MDRETIALIFQQGGRFITELIRNRPVKREMLEYQSPMIDVAKIDETTVESKATSVEAGCVPCAIGHFGTCSGLLAESLRFGRKEGIESNEVINRVNLCLDELNTMERVDLRPELIAQLPPWEKELANKALDASRATRHGLEGLVSINNLEKVAANTQTTRQDIGRAWFKERLARMPKEEKVKLAEKAMGKLEEE